MLKTTHALAAVAVLAIAACSVPQMAAVGTRAALSDETLSMLSSICQRGDPLLAIAANPAMPPQAREIGVFVRAYCGQLLAGSVPTTTDAGTANWLTANLAGLSQALGVSLR